MKVAYIIPSFPVPTETFAVSDINALSPIVEGLDVFSIRGKNSERERLLRSIKIHPRVKIHYGSILGIIVSCLNHPLVLLWLISRSFRILINNFMVGISVLVVAPRIVDIIFNIRKDDVDVVHAFWGRHPSLVLAALNRFWPSDYILSIFVGAYDLVADDELVGLGLHVSDVRFTHSRANLTYFLDKGIKDVHVIRRGIPVSTLHSSTCFSPNTILTASRLDPRKRVDLCIRVIYELRKRGHDVSLQIVGDGPDLDRLVALTKELNLLDFVNFVGYINRTEVSKLMAQSQIFLFLSEKPSERLPNVIKEALYAGCYVVSSKTPGIEELVCAPFGTVISTSDVSSIADIVEKALSEDGEKAKRRRFFARRWMAKRWSSDSSMKKYLGVWRSHVERRKNA